MATLRSGDSRASVVVVALGLTHTHTHLPPPTHLNDLLTFVFVGDLREQPSAQRMKLEHVRVGTMLLAFVTLHLTYLIHLFPFCILSYRDSRRMTYSGGPVQSIM